MPWRLIVFIVIFALFLVFITFNLENKCDISFGFASLRDVPVFITIFSSFILGFLCTIPLIAMIVNRVKNPPVKKRKQNEEIDFDESEYPEEEETAQLKQCASASNDKIKKDAAAAKKRFFLNKRKKKDGGENE